MTDPIVFDAYTGWVDITDANSIPADARRITAADLLRYEQLGLDVSAFLNSLSDSYVLNTRIGQASGAASLGTDGKVPAVQIPDLSGLYLPASLLGATNGVATLDGTKHVPVAQVPDLSGTYLTAAQKAAANGVASLDAGGMIPPAQIASSYLRLLSGIKADRDAIAAPALGQRFRRTDRNNNIQTWNGTAWKYLDNPEHYNSVAGDWVTTVSSASRILATVAAVPTAAYATVVRVRGAISVSTAAISAGVLTCQLAASVNATAVGSAQALANVNWYAPGSNWESRYVETPWVSVPAATAPIVRAWINYLTGSVGTAVSADVRQSYLIVDVLPADD